MVKVSYVYQKQIILSKMFITSFYTKTIFFICLLLSIDSHSTNLKDLDYSTKANDLFHSTQPKELDCPNKPAQLEFVNEYTFLRKISLSQKISLVNRLSRIDQKSIAIEYQSSSYNQEFKALILQGQNYENLTNQILFKCNQNNSLPKYSQNGMYLNKNRMALQKRQINNTINAIIMAQKKFQTDMIVTEDDIIVCDVDQCPILKKINTKTLKISKFQYEQNCRFMADKGVLSIILQTQQIIFGLYPNLYVLDSKTLAKKQVLIQQQKYVYSDFNFIRSFYNQTSKKSYILIERSNFQYETFYSAVQTNYIYVKGTSFYTSSIQFQLINQNQAYTIKNNHLYQWRNIFNQTVYVGFNDSTNQILLNSAIVAVSKDGNKFYTVKNPATIQCYRIDYESDNYNITKVSSIYTNRLMETKIQISSDQTLLIGYSFRLKCLTILYLQNQTIINITLTSLQTILDYALFNSELNTLLTVISRQQLSTYYTWVINRYIQIRKLNSPKNIKTQYKIQIPNQIQGEIYGYKIITHQNWGFKFVILYQTYSNTSQNCYAQLCTSINDSILCQDKLTSQISFYYFQTTSKYIITRRNSQLKVIQILQNPFNLIYYQQFQSGFQIIQADDKVLICQNIQINSYDFSSDNVQQWWIGKFYRKYWQGLPFKNNHGFIIPQKGLLYVYSSGGGGTDLPIKAIYDINYTPIYKAIQFTSKQTYIIPKSSKFIYSYLSCNLILYVQQKQDRSTQVSTYSYYLNKYINCQSYNKTQSYQVLIPQIQATNIINNARIFQVSNQKYVVIQYFVWRFICVQIRQLNKLQNIIFRQIPSNGQISLSAAQITNQGLVILTYINKIKIFTLNKEIFSSSYNIVNITSYDVNKNGNCIVLGGQSIKNNMSLSQNSTSSTVYLRITKKTEEQEQQNYKVLLLKNQYLNKQAGIIIDKQCKKIITVSYQPSQPTKNKILILNIQDPTNVKTINQYNVDGRIQQVQFIKNNTQFMLKINDNQFVSFDVNPVIMQNYQTPQIKQQVKQNQVNQDNQAKINAFNQNQEISDIKLNGQYHNKMLSYMNSFNQNKEISNKIISDINQNGEQYAMTTVESNYSEIQVFNYKNIKIGHFVPKQLNGYKIVGLSFNQLNELLVLDQKSNIYILNHKPCRSSFTNNNGYCICQQSQYYSDIQCIQCSRWCLQCNGDGLNCLRYSNFFYLIIILSTLVLLIIIISVIIVIKNKSKKKQSLLSAITNDIINNNKQNIYTNL